MISFLPSQSNRTEHDSLDFRDFVEHNNRYLLVDELGIVFTAKLRWDQGGGTRSLPACLFGEYAGRQVPTDTHISKYHPDKLQEASLPVFNLSVGNVLGRHSLGEVQIAYLSVGSSPSLHADHSIPEQICELINLTHAAGEITNPRFEPIIERNGLYSFLPLEASTT